jgi:hypothetical protein
MSVGNAIDAIGASLAGELAMSMRNTNRLLPPRLPHVRTPFRYYISLLASYHPPLFSLIFTAVRSSSYGTCQLSDDVFVIVALMRGYRDQAQSRVYCCLLTKLHTIGR